MLMKSVVGCFGWQSIPQESYHGLASLSNHNCKRTKKQLSPTPNHDAEFSTSITHFTLLT